MKKVFLLILLCLAVALTPALAEESAPEETPDLEVKEVVSEPQGEEAPEENDDYAYSEPYYDSAEQPVVEDEPYYEEPVYADPAPDAGEDPAPVVPATGESAQVVETAPEEEAPEAWLYFNDRVIAGKLQNIAENLSGDETVYICTNKLLHVHDVSLYVMAGVKLYPDYDVFPEDCHVAVYSEKPGDNGGQLADLATAQIDEYGDLYLRVEWDEPAQVIADAEPVEAPIEGDDDDEEESVSIGVDPDSFPSGEWVTYRPEFRLTGITRDSGWSYAVLDSDNRFIPISGNTYSPDSEGAYKIKFVIQDNLGDIRAVSSSIKLRLDWTAPALRVTYVDDMDYAVDISATDKTSGVTALSVDGGASWMTFENGETFRLTDSARRTLLPGMIRARDAAGNVALSDEAYVLEEHLEMKGEGDPAEGDPTEGDPAEGDPAEGDPAEGEEGDDDDDAPKITVVPSAFPADTWQTKQPQFTLSGIPEGSEWKYALLIYDQGLTAPIESPYSLTVEGKRKLQFLIQDTTGAFIATSPIIDVWGDWNPPTLECAVSEDKSYTIDITATDAGSGVTQISLDGGKTWKTWEPTKENTYTYTAEKETTFKKEDIQVKDAVGHITKSEEEYELKKVDEKEEEGDDDNKEDGDDDSEDENSSSSSSSEKKTTLPHSSGNGADASPYVLKLTLPDEPMRQLIVGGTALDLTLMVEEDGERRPTSFTGRFTRWGSYFDATSKLDPDTLVLIADVDLGLSDVIKCEWHFNGEVYRLLGEAGVKYIVFQVGDDYCALATEGFTGGTKYTEFKMLGVSTRKFDYTLTMKLDQDASHISAMTDNDFSEDCDLSVSVVVENMSYELSNSPKSLMYYYNIYLGPEDMLQFPFGKYEGLPADPEKLP